MNDDCILNILSFLEIPDINKISLLNKRFYILSKYEFIWERFYNESFYNVPCINQFYNNYKKCHILNKFLLKNKSDNINIVSNKKILYLVEDFKSIPSEIEQLSMIQEIFMSSNRLESIPPKIWELSMLRSFHLRFGRLTTISPYIELSVKLQKLVIASNELRSIPPEIGKLIMLQELDLYDNNLRSIPPEIG